MKYDTMLDQSQFVSLIILCYHVVKRYMQRKFVYIIFIFVCNHFNVVKM